MLIIDTHVHLYRSYDLKRAFEGAFQNLNRALKAEKSAQIQLGLALTERPECDFFRDLQNEKLSIPAPLKLQRIEYDRCLLVVHPSYGNLHLFAGRQFVSTEGLEVLALTSNFQLTEKLPLSSLVQKINDSGGLPVLPWSPGKWMFKRGQILRQFLQTEIGAKVVLSDSSLRPNGIAFPEFPRRVPVIHGSDPLPFAGEERRIGSFASFFHDSLDPSNLTGSLVSILRKGGEPRGRRLHFPELGLKLFKNKIQQTSALSPS